MSDHDATREILAAADDYASTWGAFNFCETNCDAAMREMDAARAHLETTIRLALARGAAIEAAANRATTLIAVEHTAARPSGYVATYEVDQPAYDVLKALDAALAPPLDGGE